MKKEFEKEQNDNQIDDAFLDMPDMEDDEKFCQWLEEEYLKEADAIEEALFDGRKFEDNQDIVEKLSVSRESFYQRAREEGLLENVADEKAEDEKNTEEAAPESTEKKILEFRKNAGVSKDSARDENRNSGKRKHSYVRFGRIAGIASLCLICVFAASMSSEANRKYLIKNIRYLAGDDTRVVTGNDEENENVKMDEYEAIADIEKKLEVKMPEFYYRPYNMNFLEYSVNNVTFYATLEYKYKDNILFFYIDKQDNNTASNISSINGKERMVERISNDNIEISIKEVEDKSDKNSTYIASWNYENVTYYIDGKIELDELEKILKEMKF